MVLFYIFTLILLVPVIVWMEGKQSICTHTEVKTFIVRSYGLWVVPTALIVYLFY